MTSHVLAIVGPTASGKSRLAMEVAKSKPAEIISADSMQIYKGMDIGTAKASAVDRQTVKHHLIDVATLDEAFSVVKYQKLARAAIEDIQKRGKLPILVGGTGLYVRATLYKLDFPPQKTDPNIRKTLEDDLRDKGLEYLQLKLKEADKSAYESIDIMNSRRVIRALEIISSTGASYADCRNDWQNWDRLYDSKIIGLTMPRPELYERINQRVDEMMKQGLLDEVKNLIKNGLKEAIVAKQALGYKELIDYLDGKTHFDEAVESIKKRTRHYAKRQYTWFNKDPNIEWYEKNVISSKARDLWTA